MAKKKRQPATTQDITDKLSNIIKLTNPKYRQSIRQARKEYQSGDTFTHKQVFGKI